MAKILVVDDEASIVTMLAYNLKKEGYDVVTAEDGEVALEKFESEKPDLLLLDIMMPKMDGYQAVREIKKIKDIPFIMLSARGEEFDKLVGFDMGVDDYVTKPFSPKELVARVKAVMKRVKREDNSYVYEGLVIDDLAHEVMIDGKNVVLTPKEYDLLKYFMQNKNIALSRDTILTNIWGYDFYGDERTVDTHVKTLRNNLGKYRDVIKTVRGMGYKFDAKEKY